MSISVIGVIIAILFFCLLVIGHEFGHFIAAKRLGVKVLEFSMGMGPLLWHSQKGETQYSLRAIPIGGFCKLEGEDGDENKEDMRSFANQPAWSKILILIMGSVMNVVMGLIILTIIFTSIGSTTSYVGEVSDGSPAAAAGILADDRIVAINGKEVLSWNDVIAATSSYDGDGSIQVILERKSSEKGNYQFPVELVPDYNEEAGRYIMGVTTKIVHSVPMSIKESLAACGSMFVSMKEFLVNLFKGRTNSEDVVGVVGIMAVVSEQAKTNGLINVIYLMGIISFNLAIVNMLPFPALDGGRILLVLLRKIARDKIGDKAEAIVNAIGFILLMILMIFLLFKDTFTFILK